MNSYIIENEYIKAEICDYGATLTSLYIKKYNTDVVLGFYDTNKYQNDGKYIGQVIGRYSNRINTNSININGELYPKESNENNCRDNGLHTKTFKMIHENNQISCYYTLEDQEDGFPGKLDVEVIYTLVKNSLKITITSKAHDLTISNITTNNYFNLKGNGDITDHMLMIDADYISFIDSDLVTLSKKSHVKNLPFNCKEPKKINNILLSNHPQIILGRGVDHNYCLNKKGLANKLTLSYEDRTMHVFTNKDNVHISTGNNLPVIIGKEEIKYGPRSGLSIQTQECPNDSSLLLKKGKTTRSITHFVFE